MGRFEGHRALGRWLLVRYLPTLVYTGVHQRSGIRYHQGWHQLLPTLLSTKYNSTKRRKYRIGPEYGLGTQYSVQVDDHDRDVVGGATVREAALAGEAAELPCGQVRVTHELDLFCNRLLIEYLRGEW